MRQPLRRMNPLVRAIHWRPAVLVSRRPGKRLYVVVGTCWLGGGPVRGGGISICDMCSPVSVVVTVLSFPRASRGCLVIPKGRVADVVAGKRIGSETFRVPWKQTKLSRGLDPQQQHLSGFHRVSHCMRHAHAAIRLSSLNTLSHPSSLDPRMPPHTLPLAPMLCGPRASQSLPHTLLVFGRHTTQTMANAYYVTRHMNKGGDVHGEIFYSERDASAQFDRYDNGPYATAVWDHQAKELQYYPGRTQQYYVTRHLDFGNVTADIYESKAEALNKFADFDGGPVAAAVYNKEIKELKYSGARGTRPEEMQKWVREHSSISKEEREEMKEWVMRTLPTMTEINCTGRDDKSFLSCSPEGSVALYTHNNGSGRQLWKLEKVQNKSADPKNDNVYYIKVSGGTRAGEEFLSTNYEGGVSLYSSDTGTGRQQWELIKDTSKISGDIFSIKVHGGTRSGEDFLSASNTGYKIFLFHEVNGSGRQLWRLPNFELDKEEEPIVIHSIDWKLMSIIPGGRGTFNSIKVGRIDKSVTTVNRTKSFNASVSAGFSAFGASASSSVSTAISKSVTTVNETTMMTERISEQTDEAWDVTKYVWMIVLEGVLLLVRCGF